MFGQNVPASVILLANLMNMIINNLCKIVLNPYMLSTANFLSNSLFYSKFTFFFSKSTFLSTFLRTFLGTFLLIHFLRTFFSSFMRTFLRPFFNFFRLKTLLQSSIFSQFLTPTCHFFYTDISIKCMLIQTSHAGVIPSALNGEKLTLIFHQWKEYQSHLSKTLF